MFVKSRQTCFKISTRCNKTQTTTNRGLAYLHLRMLSTDCMYSRALHLLSCIYPRVFHRLYVFSCFLLVACILALWTGCKYSRTLHWLDVFPRFCLVTCIPALCTGSMFSRAFGWLHACIHALSFSRALNWGMFSLEFWLVNCAFGLRTSYMTTKTINWSILLMTPKMISV